MVDENLFNEYNNLLNMLKLNLVSLEEKDSLEQRRVEIRNKILVDNMKVIDLLINRRFNDISDDNEREEIRHIGYLLLLEYIDKNYLYVDKFKRDISQMLMLGLKRRVLIFRNGYSERGANYLSKLDDIGVPIECISSDVVVKKMGVKVNKALEILNLAGISRADSCDELIKFNCSEYSYEMFDLFDDTWSKKDIISKLLLILPVKNQFVLSLYFGFNDNEPISVIEIANLLGLSKQRVIQMINESLYMLRSRVVVSELEDISGKSIDKHIINDNNKKMEMFLVMNLPVSYHNYLLSTLKKEFYQEFYKLYFIEHCSAEEISLILGISMVRFSGIKYKLLNIIRYQINIVLMKDLHIPVSYDNYMNYLMNIYLCKDNVYKCKKKTNF